MGTHTVNRTSARTIVLFALAAVLLVFGGIGTARAALSYSSGDLVANVQTSNIDVRLLENGKEVRDGKLLTGIDAKNVKPGQEYAEELSVQNTGSIDQYVRVIINKYWTDADGNKVTSVDPAMINLAIPERYVAQNPRDMWYVQKNEVKGAGDIVNSEQYIAYYKGVLSPGDVTPAITQLIAVNPEVLKDAVTTTTTNENGKTIVSTTWVYNGYKMSLDAEVQAVQTHNAEDAIRASWGVDPALVMDATQGGE